MNKQQQDSVLFGANAPFVEAIYEEYLHNPVSIDPLWRDYFDRLHQSRDISVSQLTKSQPEDKTEVFSKAPVTPVATGARIA
ncbi:MAG: hypothetical protein R3E36_01685 [Nitrosomonas sp.]|nr:hypothetical protein [Nitrosomonas sp.]